MKFKVLIGTLLALLLAWPAAADWTKTSLGPDDESIFDFTGLTDSSIMRGRCGSIVAGYVDDITPGGSDTAGSVELLWLPQANSTAADGTVLVTFVSDNPGQTFAPGPGFYLANPIGDPGGTARLWIRCASNSAGSGSGGGSATMQATCAAGEAGGDYDSSSGLYGFTCGLYPRSATEGGFTDVSAVSVSLGVWSGTRVSNHSSPTCVGGCQEWVDCTGNGVGVSRRNGLTYDGFPGPPTDNGIAGCLYPGELVIKNPVQDIMLAWEDTRPGGTVFLHVPPGHHGVVLENSGCGHYADGTSLPCTILAAPYDIQEQAGIQMAGGVKLSGPEEMVDRDGFSIPAGMERTGVWFAIDFKGFRDVCTALDAPYSGCVLANVGAIDANEIGFETQRSPFVNGTHHYLTRTCVAVGGGDGRCNVIPRRNLAVIGNYGAMRLNTSRIGAYGDELNATNSNFQSMCVRVTGTNDDGSAAGVCAGDPRVACAIGGGGGECTAAGHAATCTAFMDYVDTVSSTDGEGDTVVFINGLGLNYNNDNDNATETSYWSMVQDDDPASLCQANAGRELRPYPRGAGFEMWPTNTAVTGGVGLGDWRVQLADAHLFFSNGGGFYNISQMPASWPGRSGSSNAIHDCTEALVGNECDRYEGRTWDNAAAVGAVVKNTYNAGFTSVDGSASSFDVLIENNVFTGFFAADPDTYATFRENKFLGIAPISGGTLFGAFQQRVVFENNYFKGSRGLMFSIKGQGLIYRNNVFEQHSGGIWHCADAREILIEGNLITGYLGEILRVEPTTGSSCEALTFRSNRAHPPAGFSTSVGATRSDISFGTTGGFRRGQIDDILIEDFRVAIGFDGGGSEINKCVVSIDYIADADCTAPATPYTCCTAANDATGCQTGTFMENLDEITIRNSHARSLRGATGGKFICLMDSEAGGGGLGGGPTNKTSANDEGIYYPMIEGNPIPVMSGNTFFGVPSYEQPNRFTVAANCGDCDATPNTLGEVGEGTVCAITDDTVANGTCTDVAGVLTGGSTFDSVCVCVNSAWVPQ